MHELIIPTAGGPLALRSSQVIKLEGVPAFFVVESVNVVRNGRQVRMYHMDEAEAMKYYIPLRSSVSAAVPGNIPQPIPTGVVPQNPVAQSAAPGEVPEHLSPRAGGTGTEKKPVQGLSQNEIQDGLASGKYTQDSEGNVFKNPNFRDHADPHDGAPPNHRINPGAADQ